MKMNNTLIVSAGDSPQIITEFLYDSIDKNRNNIFDKIIIITTTHGRDLIDRYLIKGETIKKLGSKLKINDLYSDFLDIIDIRLLKDSKGGDLADLRTNKDAHSEFLQYFSIVQSETVKSNNNITFLISGGRKSSSIALSQAAMLYGRSGDQVSHVLAPISKWNDKEWWFPSDSSDKEQAITVFNLPFIGLGNFLKGIDLSNVNNITTMVQDKIDMVTPLENIKIDRNIIIIEGSKYKLQPKSAAIFRYFINNTIDSKSSNHVNHNTMIDDFESKIAESYRCCFSDSSAFVQKFEERLHDYKNNSSKIQVRDEKDQWLREEEQFHL